MHSLTHSPEEQTVREPELAAALLTPAVGSTAGRFRLQQVVARGGAGTVYRASDADGPVAVKVLAMPAEARAEVLERFDREVRALQHIGHGNVVELVDFGRLGTHGQPFIALEWIEGCRLGHHIKERGALSLAETWAISQQLLLALGAVHEAGYVHRDVSANNVMLTQLDGRLRVKLIDFGLVKPRPGHYQAVTRPGVVVGTPSVMAPEQFEPPRVDERADIYAVGVLLSFMLTGRNPLQGASLAEAGRRLLTDSHVRRPSEDVALHPAVDAVVTRCLERAPERRYPNVAQLAAELERVVRHAQSSTLRTRARNVAALCVRARARSPLTERALEEIVRDLTAELRGGSVRLDDGVVLALVDAPLDGGGAQELLAQATQLMERVAAHQPQADVVLTLHSDTVLLRTDNAQVMGGPVLEMIRWPLPEEGTVFVSSRLLGLLPILRGRAQYGELTRVV